MWLNIHSCLSVCCLFYNNNQLLMLAWFDGFGKGYGSGVITKSIIFQLHPSEITTTLLLCRCKIKWQFFSILTFPLLIFQLGKLWSWKILPARIQILNSSLTGELNCAVTSLACMHVTVMNWIVSSYLWRQDHLGQSCQPSHTLVVAMNDKVLLVQHLQQIIQIVQNNSTLSGLRGLPK